MISLKKYKPYKKQFDFSYSFGGYPTVELLRHKPDQVEAILHSKDINNSQNIDLIREECEKNNIPLLETDRVHSLTKSDNTHVLGVVKKYPMTLSPDRPHIVLVEPDDMGNVGTILRSLVGFGYKDLALIGQSVDFWSPKVLRACMGSIFSASVEKFPDISDYKSRFPNHDLFSFMLDRTATPLEKTSFPKTHSLVFGNEGSGLPKDFANISNPVFIEQTEKIDSLNLSVAASIAMHHIFSHPC